MNVFRQRGTTALAIRSIKTDVPTFSELHLPEVILDIANKSRGLILVTGTTGSGKSTLLASMVDHVNGNKAVNIVTIEDPIEYLHRNKKSIIAQREIGTDADTFQQALRACFRQDPNTILIGEIRDVETMETALSASDTGHLVMSTLHTMNAMETISRVVSFFPPHNAAMKEYIYNPQKANLIPDAIAEGYMQYGSQTFDQSLYSLYKNDLISFEVALQYASNPDDFELKVAGGVSGTSDRKWIDTM
jgi:twitching motility protein PilT